VRRQQDVGVRGAERRLEPVAGQLDQEPQRVGEVDRVHEPAVLDAAVLDAALVEALHGLAEGRVGQRERHVVHRSRLGGQAFGIGGAAFVGEDGDQAAVPRIEVQVALL
jgi:hypothetical protein